MLVTRGYKYGAFLLALRSFKYLSLSPKRGGFLEAYYSLMRYIDDIVDGDAKLPGTVNSAEEYVKQKIDFTKSLQTPKDALDHLMIYCFEIANEFGEDFSDETQDILYSLHFDASRIGKMEVFPEEELTKHFYQLDIRGTVKASLKVFGENPNKYVALEPLGLASRIYYNLRDFHEDIRAGLVNISAEDCAHYGISLNELENIALEGNHTEGIRRWFLAQSALGRKLLDKHKDYVSKAELGWLARVTLPIVYETSARKFFEKVFTDMA